MSNAQVDPTFFEYDTPKLLDCIGLVPKSGVAYPCRLSLIDSQVNSEEVLHADEKSQIANYKTTQKKAEFLRGRIAAKAAITGSSDFRDYNKICIKNGIFEQPTFTCTNNSNQMITLTHSQNVAIAMSFPSDLLLGIDLEKKSPINQNTKRSILNNHENGIVNLTEKSGQDRILNALWSAKESISKAIRTGFTADPEIFAISEAQQSNAVSIKVQFQHFTRLNCIVFDFPTYTFAITKPMDIQFNEPEVVTFIKMHLKNTFYPD